MPQVEVCCYSVADCQVAEACGADRVELCGGRYEGGTTPSAGLIKLARQCLTLDLYVMIRPREGDFLYSKDEFEVMENDIRLAKSLDVDGLVLGVLQANGTVDADRMARLFDLAYPLPITFHRAFDVTADPVEALETIIEAGCVRILTSGQQNHAIDGKILITKLLQQANGRIEIMAGSGVNAQNARELIDTGINALHLTGKSTRDSLMKFRNPNLSMGGVAGIPEYELAFADAAKIRDVVALAK